MNSEITFAIEMKKIVSIILLVLVQCFAFASIYAGNANLDASYSHSHKKVFSASSTTTNFWVDVFENENETEDETELNYHSILLPISLILNFDLVTILTESDSFQSQNKYCAISKYGVFITNRQLLI